MPKIAKQTRKPKKRKQGVGIIDGIVPVADLLETGVKFLIYGLSGSGKTTLACSFPKPLLMVRPEQVEDGSRSIRTVKGVDATPFLTSPDELTEICEYQRENDHYKTIVLDGVTKFQDLVLKKVVDLKDTPVQLNWGIASQQDWGTIANELKEHFRQLMRLAESGCNIVVLGGERAFNTDTESDLLAPSVMIALSPSCTGWLHEVCDYNVHSFLRCKTETRTKRIGKKTIEQRVPVEGVEYCLRVGPDEVYQTKFRVPKNTDLPQVIIDPSYGKLKKYLV